MKNFYLILFWSVMNVTVQAQTNYHPFIENNKVWKVGIFPAMGTKPTSIQTYYFGGDTIVGEHCCRKWLCDGHLVATIFEEGQRVCFFEPGKSEAKVLYDFSEISGSRFTASAIGQNLTLTCYLDSISVIDCSNGENLHCYHLYDEQGIESGLPKEQVMYEWVEGIGSLVRPDSNIGIGGMVGDYSRLMEVRVGDTILFSSSLLNGISSIHNERETGDNPSYDLSGRVVRQQHRGIFVRKGRKTLVW